MRAYDQKHQPKNSKDKGATNALEVSLKALLDCNLNATSDTPL